MHQHLWPDELVDRLRARSKAPYLRGWTLHTDGEPPYDVDPAGHDVATRIAADRDAGVGSACLSLSAPLGIESLLRPEAQPLIDAWHRGVRELPDHFQAWASVPAEDAVRRRRCAGCWTRTASSGSSCPPPTCSRPSPGSARPSCCWPPSSPASRSSCTPDPSHVGSWPAALPEWWAPVVGYTAQLQAAWWGWHAFGGRRLFPRLRLLFGAGAGLAPVLVERHALRGGGRTTVDPDVFVDTSGTGARALEAVVRVLGIDALVLGSDRPYGEPLEEFLGDAATHAVRVANPARLLGSGSRRAGR